MPPDKYGDALTLAQIAFYVVGAIVAIPTYRAARRGLLNTVNTEYQKRVMDRLHRLSEDLYSEFDESSDTHGETTNIRSTAQARPPKRRSYKTRL